MKTFFVVAALLALIVYVAAVPIPDDAAEWESKRLDFIRSKIQEAEQNGNTELVSY